jgi:ribonuclease P protein component
LIRESYRLQEDKIGRGYDMVVVARVNAKGRSYQEIASAFLHLCRLHRILVE